MDLLDFAVLGSNNSSSKVVTKFVVKSELMSFVFDDYNEFLKFNHINNEFRYSIQFLDNYKGVNNVLLFDYLNGKKEYYSKVNDHIIKYENDHWMLVNNSFFIDFEYGLFNEKIDNNQKKKLKCL